MICPIHGVFFNGRHYESHSLKILFFETSGTDLLIRGITGDIVVSVKINLSEGCCVSINFVPGGHVMTPLY